jgi:hypothetical protein
MERGGGKISTLAKRVKNSSMTPKEYENFGNQIF